MLLKKGDAFGLVLLLGVLMILGAFFFFAPKASPVVYEPVELTGSALTVHVISPETLTEVTVDATLLKSGFVTVHEAIGAAPGPVLGVSRLLEPGTYADEQITLSHSMDPDTPYFALVFVDDGDGVYEPGVDLPVSSDGKVIKRAFTTPM